jgi:hypothetical protein
MESALATYAARLHELQRTLMILGTSVHDDRTPPP